MNVNPSFQKIQGMEFGSKWSNHPYADVKIVTHLF